MEPRLEAGARGIRRQPVAGPPVDVAQMADGRGAQGVGRATKSAVEAAAVLILATNFILTSIFFSI